VETNHSPPVFNPPALPLSPSGPSHLVLAPDFNSTYPSRRNFFFRRRIRSNTRPIILQVLPLRLNSQTTCISSAQLHPASSCPPVRFILHHCLDFLLLLPLRIFALFSYIPLYSPVDACGALLWLRYGAVFFFLIPPSRRTMSMLLSFPRPSVRGVFSPPVVLEAVSSAWQTPCSPIPIPQNFAPFGVLPSALLLNTSFEMFRPPIAVQQPTVFLWAPPVCSTESIL